MELIYGAVLVFGGIVIVCIEIFRRRKKINKTKGKGDLGWMKKRL